MHGRIDQTGGQQARSCSLELLNADLVMARWTVSESFDVTANLAIDQARDYTILASCNGASRRLARVRFDPAHPVVDLGVLRFRTGPLPQ